MMELWPFTNFHDLNLDWIISKIKNIEKAEKNTANSADAAANSADAAADSAEAVDAIAKNLKSIDMVADPPVSIGRYGRILDDLTDGSSQHLELQSIVYAEGKYFTSGYTVGATPAERRITSYTDNGVEITSTVHNDMTHGQGLAYYDGVLYQSTESSILKVDPGTLATIGTLNAGNFTSIVAIASDENEGVLYVIEDTGALIITAIDLDSDSELYTVTTGRPRNAYTQSATFYEGFIYLLFNKDNQIAAIDPQTGDIVRMYKVPNDDGYFYTGELEDVFVYNNRVCVMGAIYQLRRTPFTSYIAQLFETSISTATNGMLANNYRIEDEPRSVTVNGNATYEFNPLTTFTCLDEINCLAIPTTVYVSNISGGTVTGIRNNLSIIGSSGTRNITSIIWEGGNVNITGVDTIGYLGILDCNVYIQAANVTTMRAERCKIESKGTLFNNVTEITRCKVEMYSIEYTGIRLNLASSCNTSYVTIIGHVQVIDQNNWAAFYAKLLEIFTPFNDTSAWMSLEESASLGGGVYYPVNLYARLNVWKTQRTVTNDARSLSIGPTSTNVYPGSIRFTIN